MATEFYLRGPAYIITSPMVHNNTSSQEAEQNKYTTKEKNKK
uniref:Uncharacterized protein n=1 Tax=Anguilla anguilla TaxID=7936 RepID=A0A0E9PGX3_ANGAN